MNNNHYYPEKLAEIRKGIGTQEEVAEKLGISNITLSRAENGKNASYELLCAIASLANVDVRDLLKSNEIMSSVT